MTVILTAAQAVTNLPTSHDTLGRQTDVALVIEGAHLVALGPRPALLARYPHAEVVAYPQGIVVPGFVDAHTHVVFGGSRVQEYAARLTHSPAEVRALGIPTGILASVAHTRAASPAALVAAARERLWGLLRHGVTTVESKTGYGLTTADELKMLHVNQQLQAELPLTLISTFLGAHAVPPEEPREQYVARVIDEMLPQAASLATFADVYCDEGYFTVEDSRAMLQAAHAHGLRLKIHADQYSALGASDLAAELGCVSADHLNFTAPPAMRRLAQAGVVGVLMPAIDFAVRHPRPPNVPALREAGVTLALASDICPGGWVENMFLVLQLACRQWGLSVAEAVRAATLGGALACGLTDRGTLAPGQRADLQVWHLPSVEDALYRLGSNPVSAVWVGGRQVI